MLFSSRIKKRPLFKPYPYIPDVGGIEEWQLHSSKNWYYSVNGRSALFHILRSLKARRILVPGFICRSVIEAIDHGGLEYDFFDLSPQTLLPSVDSLSAKLEKERYDVVLWPTLYGQPDSISDALEVCRRFKVKIIDDAAQAFGAFSNGCPVGEFGDAGFFSFSPGKPTAAAMGAFFWTSTPLEISRTANEWFHRYKYLEFSINRLNRYSLLKSIRLGYFFSILNSILSKKSFYYFDKMNDFEKPVLGGILHREINPNVAEVRRKKFSRLCEILKFSSAQVISGDQDKSNPHKCVLYIRDASMCTSLKTALKNAGISFGNGYRSLSVNCRVASEITGHIVELPIDFEDDAFEELVILLSSWLEGTINMKSDKEV